MSYLGSSAVVERKKRPLKSPFDHHYAVSAHRFSRASQLTFTLMARALAAAFLGRVIVNTP